VTHEEFKSMGYRKLRVVAGGKLCGILPQLFTTSLVVGLNDVGYERRYCYEKSYEAEEMLAAWDGVGDPPGPWVKEKPSDRLGPGAAEIF